MRHTYLQTSSPPVEIPGAHHLCSCIHSFRLLFRNYETIRPFHTTWSKPISSSNHSSNHFSLRLVGVHALGLVMLQPPPQPSINKTMMRKIRTPIILISRMKRHLPWNRPTIFYHHHTMMTLCNPRQLPSITTLSSRQEIEVSVVGKSRTQVEWRCKRDDRITWWMTKFLYDVGQSSYWQGIMFDRFVVGLVVFFTNRVKREQDLS